MKLIRLDFLSKLFPFKGLRDSTLRAIFADAKYSVMHFSRGDLILSPKTDNRCVGFVVEGECTVETKCNGDGGVTLNRVSKYGSFGILSVLGDAEYPTAIYAASACDLLFISADEMTRIIKKYPTVAMNVIKFLADRIAFLNSRIKTFSEKTTLEKLVAYLLYRYVESGEEIEISKTALASEIGVGRASLYRDLDTLVSEGIIALKSKTVIIICPKGLERIKQ